MRGGSNNLVLGLPGSGHCTVHESMTKTGPGLGTSGVYYLFFL